MYKTLIILTHIVHPLCVKYGPEWSFPGGSVVKNLPLTQKTWVYSLGWEDPLEKGKVTYSSILTQRIKSRKESDWTEQHTFTHIFGDGLETPVI